MSEPDPFKINEAVLDLWRDYVAERDAAKELQAENARLKAQVERLKLDAYKKLLMRIEIDKLKARIEYLTNAGDVMADAINGDYNHSLPCVEAWTAAKGGKP